MALSGRADNLLRFFKESLLPQMDASFATDTLRRLLVGHSLSGYFTMYALSQQLASGRTIFHHYIAASPSLHYNKYWLPGQLKQLRAGKASKGTSVYVTFGGLEDAEDADEPGLLKVAQLTSQIATTMRPLGMKGKAEVFGNLGHMETPIPTFIKGLQRVLKAD
jgi:predicted alpha/beta superfamily hydrolase